MFLLFNVLIHLDDIREYGSEKWVGRRTGDIKGEVIRDTMQIPVFSYFHRVLSFLKLHFNITSKWGKEYCKY